MRGTEVHKNINVVIIDVEMGFKDLRVDAITKGMSVDIKIPSYNTCVWMSGR